MRRISILATTAFAVLAACADTDSRGNASPPLETRATLTPSEQPAATTTAAPSGALHDSLSADTRPMLLQRPTVVAFSTLTQADVDADPDMGEALSDFQAYLGSARDSLAKLGVDFAVEEGDTIAWRDSTQVKRWIAPADSTAMGYVLLLPGGAPRVKYGVETDGGLVTWVTSELHAPSER